MAARGGKREAAGGRGKAAARTTARGTTARRSPRSRHPRPRQCTGRGEHSEPHEHRESCPVEASSVAHRDKTVRFRLNVPSGDESLGVRFRDEEDDGRHERGDMTHRDGPSRNSDGRHGDAAT